MKISFKKFKAHFEQRGQIRKVREFEDPKQDQDLVPPSFFLHHRRTLQFHPLSDLSMFSVEQSQCSGSPSLGCIWHLHL